MTLFLIFRLFRKLCHRRLSGRFWMWILIERDCYIGMTHYFINGMSCQFPFYAGKVVLILFSRKDRIQRGVSITICVRSVYLFIFLFDSKVFERNRTFCQTNWKGDFNVPRSCQKGSGSEKLSRQDMPYILSARNDIVAHLNSLLVLSKFSFFDFFLCFVTFSSWSKSHPLESYVSSKILTQFLQKPPHDHVWWRFGDIEHAQKKIEKKSFRKRRGNFGDSHP